MGGRTPEPGHRPRNSWTASPLRPSQRSPSAEEIDEFLAGGSAERFDLAEDFGGPGSGRYPKGSGKHPATGSKPPAGAIGVTKDPGALPDRIPSGFKPNAEQLKKMIAPLEKILDGLDKDIATLGPIPKAKALHPSDIGKDETVKSKVAELEKHIAAAKTAKTPQAKAAALQQVADARAELGVLKNRAIAAVKEGKVSADDDIKGKPHKPVAEKQAPPGSITAVKASA